MEWITPTMDGHGPTNDQHCLVDSPNQNHWSSRLVHFIGLSVQN